jgi:hypothetical protein
MPSAQKLKVLDGSLRVGSSGDGVSSVVLAVEDLVCLSTQKELARSGGRHGPHLRDLTNQNNPVNTTTYARMKRCRAQ